jgi:hypothetical protein
VKNEDNPFIDGKGNPISGDSQYRKIIADGKIVAVFSVHKPMARHKELLRANLRGVEIKPASQEEFEQHGYKIRKKKKGECLVLPGYPRSKKGTPE